MSLPGRLGGRGGLLAAGAAGGGGHRARGVLRGPPARVGPSDGDGVMWTERLRAEMTAPMQQRQRRGGIHGNGIRLSGPSS